MLYRPETRRPGISLLEDGHFASVRAVGNLDNLHEAIGGGGGGVAVAERTSTTGIGHTRWATHGRVSEANAHPLSDDDERVHVVLNGIVENYMEIKRSLSAEGAEFSSETDAEVVVHLIERHYEGNLVDAVRAAYSQLEGHFAFVAIHHDHPDQLVGARFQCPLVVGLGKGG